MICIQYGHGVAGLGASVPMGRHLAMYVRAANVTYASHGVSISRTFSDTDFSIENA